MLNVVSVCGVIFGYLTISRVSEISWTKIKVYINNKPTPHTYIISLPFTNSSVQMLSNNFSLSIVRDNFSFLKHGSQLKNR